MSKRDPFTRGRKTPGNPLGLHARYVDRPKKVTNKEYQVTFVDEIIRNLQSGKMVVTTKRFLLRFQARIRSTGISLPVHIKIEEPTITIIPKSGLAFPPETVNMTREKRTKAHHEKDEDDGEQ